MSRGEKDQAELLAMMERDAGDGIPEIGNRDAALALLPDLDFDAQLLAIRHLLRRNREADQQLEREMQDLSAYAHRTGSEHAQDDWGELFQISVHQDAAHSMAAVGVLAPLLESIFYQAFQKMPGHLESGAGRLASHPRGRLAAADLWDCHFFWKAGGRQKNIVEGVLQLSDAAGLKPHLPADLRPTLDALFAYRNKMFHCGFEWPDDERRAFEARIRDSNWPSDWFARATRGGDPWIFYMSELFIEHSLTTIDQVIDGLGAFVRMERQKS
ncbi:MAG: hypothetical protein P4M05_03335 [Bradyrhizobium sp.]|nr:hypothetical protein [Bradyrhizobium sp.]